MTTWRCSTVTMPTALCWHCLLMMMMILMLTLSCCTSAAKHTWVVQLDEGGEVAARSIANSHYLEYHGTIPHLNNKFVLKLNPDSSAQDGSTTNRPSRSFGRKRRSVLPHHDVVHRSLERHPQISWVSYQREVTRSKRDFMPDDFYRRDADSKYSEAQPSTSQISRAVSDFSPAQLNGQADGIFVDPLWPKQWYLHDTRTSPDQPKLDLHVIPAWRKNLTGRGIVVTIVDDGLERDHPDLVANYDARASYNYNNDTSDPMPRYVNLEDERHGTRCAGEVAMSANNSHCGVGIAFNARIGGVKILDGGMTDLLEARGMSHALGYVDIYSSSWGPTDDGKTMDGPGPLVEEAIKVGVEKGRGGRGALFVWASGNGGAFGDNCNCDGYAASLYTIAVGAATQSLSAPWYSEHCSATMATTFSSGAVENGEHQMVSTDLRHKCTEKFTGTSASAPVASAILALLLEANSNLTWRDVQHAIVWTAEVAPLLGNGGWEKNAAGHRYHHRFGFGLFNVGAMTDLVRPSQWINVPDKATVKLNTWHCKRGWNLKRGKSLRCQLTVDASTVEAKVKYLEHVQLRVKMQYPDRGALAVYISSAAGTRSQLLTRRRHDTATTGLPSWAFMTVHFWGENPTGIWTVKIEDQSEKPNSHKGALEELELILHGTAEAPDHRVRAGGYRQYNKDYNYVKNMQQRKKKQNKKQQARKSKITHKKKMSNRPALPSDWDDSTIDYSKRVAEVETVE